MKFRFALLNGLAGGWLYLVCAAPAHGASLGALQVRSALGERLDASIPVALVDGENIASNCFQLVAASDEGMTSLRSARLVFDAQSSTRGVLQIRSNESVQEPLLAIAVRLQCPGESAANFQREYQIMLDPREMMPASNLAPAGNGNSGAPVVPMRRSRPLAPAVDANAGDSGAASAVAPRRKARRATEGAGYSAPLRASGSRLNLQSVPPASLPPANGQPGQLQLRLSEPQLPPAALVPLSPADAQKKRQELAAITQDQTAQLAAMETRLAELNARLLTLQAQLNGASAPVAAQGAAATSAAPANGNASDLANTPPALATTAGSATAAASVPAHRIIHHAPPQAATPTDAGIDWWWWLLLPAALVALLAAFFYWRSRQQWRHVGDDETLDDALDANTVWPEPVRRNAVAAPVLDAEDAGSVAPVAAAATIATPAALAAQDWHGEADVSVVQPDNVSEEAQLLMDHGLPEHAISLLTQEVDQRPNSLALWMKLFEAYRMTGQKEEFQERALGFGMQFASDSLWQQVQEIGRTLDPANPLYHSVDEIEGEDGIEAAAPAPQIPPHLIPHDTSAFDPMPALDPDAPLVLNHTLPDAADTRDQMQSNPVQPVSDTIEFVYTSPEEVAATLPPAPPAADATLVGEALEFDLQPHEMPAGLNAPELSFDDLSLQPQSTLPAAHTPALEDPFASLLAEAAPMTTPEEARAILDEIAPLPAAHAEFDPFDLDGLDGLEGESLEAAAIEEPQDAGEMFDLAPAALPPADELDLQPPAPPPVPADAGWKSNDPAMQKIAAMLEKGETEPAFRLLEELLYTGNGEQRQQALKWLERLYPAKRA
ncbi:type IV pilus assembly protein FimV [Amantichitinum ursilacus]|uniref:type IV pilus assembly protein FimV n=1 Tax=Amantichitinum ursilacus TaxID=857265 RepID=UPI00402B601E